MIPYEIELKNRTIQAEILDWQDDLVKVSIEGKIYNLDIRKVEPGIYSLIHNGKSFEMEITGGKEHNEYVVQTDGRVWSAQIIDAEVRFQRNRNKGSIENGTHHISSPMPGKVVKILVSPGEEVKEGQTLIIISAMKMESEYKAPKDTRIKEILVKQDDTIDGNQTLITLE